LGFKNRILAGYKNNPYLPDWLGSVSLIEFLSLLNFSFTDNQTEIITELFKLLTQVLITLIIVFKYLRNKKEKENESNEK
jgi:uncharacterized membrane protein YkvI